MLHEDSWPTCSRSIWSVPSLDKLPLTLSSTCFAVIRVSSPFCLRYLLPYPATCSQGGSSGLHVWDSFHV